MADSKLVARLKERARPQHAIDVSGFITHTGEPLPRIVFRVNSKADEIAAIRAAHIAADRVAHGLTEGARKELLDDQDLLTDLKTCEALWRCCRDADNPAEPAFVAPEWMLEQLSTDELSALLNCYLECRKRSGPLAWQISREWVQSVRDAIVAMAGDDEVPTTVLASFSREYLTDFVVAMAHAWAEDVAAQPAQQVADVPSQAPIDEPAGERAGDF